jgi:hypothetical protein
MSTSLGDRAALSTGGPARPRTVTIAAVLLVVLAILEPLFLAMSFAIRDTLGEDGPTNAIARQFSDGATSISGYGVGCSVLLSAIFLALAAGLLRGRHPARIATWAFSGLCLVTFVVGGTLADPSTPAQAAPRWYLESSATLLVLALASYPAIIVLLALRPSSRYFAERPA